MDCIAFNYKKVDNCNHNCDDERSKNENIKPWSPPD